VVGEQKRHRSHNRCTRFPFRVLIPAVDRIPHPAAAAPSLALVLLCESP
jgi:hypothetical protein